MKGEEGREREGGGLIEGEKEKERGREREGERERERKRERQRDRERERERENRSTQRPPYCRVRGTFLYGTSTTWDLVR